MFTFDVTARPTTSKDTIIATVVIMSADVCCIDGRSVLGDVSHLSFVVFWRVWSWDTMFFSFCRFISKRTKSTPELEGAARADVSVRFMAPPHLQRSHQPLVTQITSVLCTTCRNGGVWLVQPPPARRNLPHPRVWGEVVRPLARTETNVAKTRYMLLSTSPFVACRAWNFPVAKSPRHRIPGSGPSALSRQSTANHLLALPETLVGSWRGRPSATDPSMGMPSRLSTSAFCGDGSSEAPLGNPSLTGFRGLASLKNSEVTG